jgi:hypothetical protein
MDAAGGCKLTEELIALPAVHRARPFREVIHPGRAWTERCVKCRHSEQEILEGINSHLNRRHSPTSG